MLGEFSDRYGLRGRRYIASFLTTPFHALHTRTQENPGTPIPIDLVTSSGSGLDPDISPAAAAFQIPRVARERNIAESELIALICKHTMGRQFGILGEPRVNVLELNLDLDASYPRK